MALYATNRFAGDGTTTSYEFNFVGKYIARTHVKVYQEDNATKVRTYVSINDSNFLNDTTLRSLPITPVGSTLVIYRDTPKPPIVDFVNGSRFTEYNLDLVARQGLFVAMEALDAGIEVHQALRDTVAAVVDLETAAAASAAIAAALADEFARRNLGSRASPPTTDDHGEPLLTGALYWDTSLPGMRSWDGGAWVTLPAATKASVGLANVDNTSDANKPISTATQSALNAKFDKTGGDVNGNIDFTGTARRITGDFSNATFANRVMFQTSTTNANTDIGILPNGVASSAGIWAFNNGSNLSNTSFLRSYINGATDVRFESGMVGAYSFLPMTFHTGGSERMRIDISGNVLATSGAIGYGAGAGGAVVQATSKSTSVTLNKPCGRITMHNAALAGDSSVRFIVNNTFVGAADEISVWLSNPISPSTYDVAVDGVGPGGFGVRLRNIVAISSSDSVVLGFAVRKGATS